MDCLGSAVKRTDMQARKEETLIETIADCFRKLQTNDNDRDASAVFGELVASGCLLISAPSQEPPMQQMILLDSLDVYQKGKSIKPGNILLNAGRLLDTIPEITGMVVSMAVDIPILKVCALLALWKALRNCLTVEITKEQAVVIIALWKKCSPGRKIELEDGFHSANVLFRYMDEPELSFSQYNKVIDQLVRMRCMELEEGVIWLREWISKKYIK